MLRVKTRACHAYAVLGMPHHAGAQRVVSGCMAFPEVSLYCDACQQLACGAAQRSAHALLPRRLHVRVGCADEHPRVPFRRDDVDEPRRRLHRNLRRRARVRRRRHVGRIRLLAGASGAGLDLRLRRLSGSSRFLTGAAGAATRRILLPHLGAGCSGGGRRDRRGAGLLREAALRDQVDVRRRRRKLPNPRRDARSSGDAADSFGLLVGGAAAMRPTVDRERLLVSPSRLGVLPRASAPSRVAREAAAPSVPTGSRCAARAESAAVVVLAPFFARLGRA